MTLKSTTSVQAYKELGFSKWKHASTFHLQKMIFALWHSYLHPIMVGMGAVASDEAFHNYRYSSCLDCIRQNAAQNLVAVDKSPDIDMGASIQTYTDWPVVACTCSNCHVAKSSTRSLVQLTRLSMQFSSSAFYKNWTQSASNKIPNLQLKYTLFLASHWSQSRRK